MKALDIKQTAEKNILFYQEQIEAAVRKMPAVYLDQAVGGLLDEWTKLFKNYRTAVYSFAFSSLLEVLLLGNFQQSYLDQVAEKTRRYRERYQTLFAQCRDRLRTLSGDSVESKLLSGIGNASRALGRLIASAPVLGQGAADKWLEESGEKVKAVLLRETFDSPAESDMVISMLAAYGIPCFKYYDKDGGAGKVINGFSGYGASLYVPQTMLEEAQNILNAEAVEEDENDAELHE